MKTDFSINVNVSLGVTPEVIALVGAILSKKPVPVVAEQQPSKDDHQEDAPQAPQKKPNERSSKTDKAEHEQQPSGEEAAPGETGDNSDGDNDTNDTKDETQAQTQEQQPPIDKAPASKFPTAADLRKAMNDLRDRIEGEDYANKKNTDAKVKALHRLVTSTLKNVADLFGAEKPSEIVEDKRQAFMDEIALLELSSDGSKLEKP
ncbi:hypothetical protein FYJ72_08825 [Prevotella copri]|uniref:Uncharacterized protein n=1 Tax=Segatella copri TaxID=165179 RepID=A0A6I2TVJ2_9BACT|nr:hypothetical protein [Segatella copri]MST77781.1 hypothetical protein [Segatella copri]